MSLRELSKTPDLNQLPPVAHLSQICQAIRIALKSAWPKSGCAESMKLPNLSSLDWSRLMRSAPWDLTSRIEWYHVLEPNISQRNCPDHIMPPNLKDSMGQGTWKKGLLVYLG